MIEDFKHFELFGHLTFSKAIVKAPFRMAASMQQEACFYYVISGNASVLASNQQFVLEAEEGLLMQCGNYINDYLETNQTEACEAIGVHFNQEVLKLLYDKDFPNFLLDAGKLKSVGYKKLKSDAVMKNYVDNLKFYFNHPELVSEELLKIKLKELILLLAKTDNGDKIQQLIKRLFCKEVVDFKEVIEANIYIQIQVLLIWHFYVI